MAKKRKNNLQQQIATLKERNKTLVEENEALKEQVEMMYAFRETEQNEQREGSSEESSEQEEESNSESSAEKDHPDTDITNTSSPAPPTTAMTTNYPPAGTVVQNTPTKLDNVRGELRTQSGSGNRERTSRSTPIRSHSTDSTRKKKKSSREEKKSSRETEKTKGEEKSKIEKSSKDLKQDEKMPGKDSKPEEKPHTIEHKTKDTKEIKFEDPEVKLKSKDPIPKDNKDQPAIFDENTVVDIVAGLEVTINRRTYSKSDQTTDLIPQDYTDSYQFKIRRKGFPLLKFKDFAPKVFYQIRKHFGVSGSDYLRSFSLENVTSIKGEGKSGAFFIFTKDKQFILKTATAEERDFLWRVLPYYWQYMRRNPNSLLPRFYGVYSMKHEGIGGVTRFVIMNNIFNTPYDPVEKFDLKGSSVGRSVSEKKRKSGAILKDLDIKEQGKKLYLPPDKCQAFITQIEKDSQFLSTRGVMDYSLLLGIYYPTEKNKAKVEANLKKRKEGGTYIPTLKQNAFQEHFNGVKAAREDGAEEIYYIGIIDILIEYAAKKKVEHILKWIAYAGEEVSVVEPEFYKQRFDKFIRELVFLPQSDKPEKKESSESDEISSETGEGPDKLEKAISSSSVSLPSPPSTNALTSNNTRVRVNDEKGEVKVNVVTAVVTNKTTKFEDKSTRKVASPPSKDTVTVNKKQKN